MPRDVDVAYVAYTTKNQCIVLLTLEWSLTHKFLVNLQWF